MARLDPLQRRATVELHVTGGSLIDPGHYDGLADIIVENEHAVGIVSGRPLIDGKLASN